MPICAMAIGLGWPWKRSTGVSNPRQHGRPSPPRREHHLLREATLLACNPRSRRGRGALSQNCDGRRRCALRRHPDCPLGRGYWQAEPREHAAPGSHAPPPAPLPRPAPQSRPEHAGQPDGSHVHRHPDGSHGDRHRDDRDRGRDHGDVRLQRRNRARSRRQSRGYSHSPGSRNPGRIRRTRHKGLRDIRRVPRNRPWPIRRSPA
jgi:hypothetical protein